jgi:ribonuclease P protein component
MPKQQRLSRADFASLTAAKQRRFFGVYFSLSMAFIPTNGSVSKLNCACVVSKKVASNAVDRNLIKRRCREVCRLNIKSLMVPVSLIFYTKKEAKGATYSEIEKDIKRLLTQASM